jgi:hypothetical protein
LSKKLEPSWRLSKGKEAHQSIHCHQGKLVPFYPTFKQQASVAMPPADIERTAPSPEVQIVTYQSISSSLRAAMKLFYLL